MTTVFPIDRLLATWKAGETVARQRLHAALGIWREGAEVGDLVHKREFKGRAYDKEAMIDEIGDTIYYILIVAYLDKHYDTILPMLTPPDDIMPSSDEYRDLLALGLYLVSAANEMYNNGGTFKSLANAASCLLRLLALWHIGLGEIDEYNARKLALATGGHGWVK